MTTLELRTSFCVRPAGVDIIVSFLKMSRTAYAICSKNSILLSYSMLPENVIISPDYYCMLHCIFSALKWKPFVSLNKQPISKSIVNRKSLSRVFSRKWTFFILTESLCMYALNYFRVKSTVKNMYVYATNYLRKSIYLVYFILMNDIIK